MSSRSSASPMGAPIRILQDAQGAHTDCSPSPAGPAHAAPRALRQEERRP